MANEEVKNVKSDALKAAVTAIRGKVYTKTEADQKILDKFNEVPTYSAGTGISIGANGEISATGDAAVDPSALPAASKTQKGAVIIGDGIDIVDGKISVKHPTKVSEFTNDSLYQTKSEVEAIAEQKAAAKVAEVVDGAPEAFDTLKEIADALQGNDAVDGIITTLGKKANKDEVYTKTEVNSAIDGAKSELNAEIAKKATPADISTAKGELETSIASTKTALETEIGKCVKAADLVYMTAAEAQAMVDEVFA